MSLGFLKAANPTETGGRTPRSARVPLDPQLDQRYPHHPDGETCRRGAGRRLCISEIGSYGCGPHGGWTTARSSAMYLWKRQPDEDVRCNSLSCLRERSIAG